MYLNTQDSGVRLKQERERLGLSQKDAASAVGIRREMWAKYETGAEPGAKALAAMTRVGIDIIYVLTGSRSFLPQPPVALSPRERALLDNYRHSGPEGQRVLEGAARLAAQPGVVTAGSK